jgi:hypothetical protein
LINHAAARLRWTLIAGIDLHLLSANSILKAGSVVSAKGASIIDDHGTAGWQAAHALPCGLIVSGRPAYLRAPGPASMRHVGEPYGITNKVPSVVNAADQLAERFRARSGLVRAFESFGKEQVQTKARDGKIDFAWLSNSYSQLVKGYCGAFEIALSAMRPTPLQGKTWESGHVTIDPNTFRPSEKDYLDEDIRSILRYQLRGTADIGYSLLRRHLVEEVEHKFHESLKQDGVR